MQLTIFVIQHMAWIILNNSLPGSQFSTFYTLANKMCHTSSSYPSSIIPLLKITFIYVETIRGTHMDPINLMVIFKSERMRE
jgi:hypothetical protein